MASANRSRSGDDRSSGVVPRRRRSDAAIVTEVLDEIGEPVIRYCRARIGVGREELFSADDVAYDILSVVAREMAGDGDLMVTPKMVYDIASHHVSRALEHATGGSDGADDEATRFGGPAELDLASLPAGQREVLVLRMIVGLDADETAAALGWRPRSVRRVQHEALDTLRTGLAHRSAAALRAAGPAVPTTDAITTDAAAPISAPSRTWQ